MSVNKILIQLGDIDFFSYEPSKMKYLLNTEQNFINHGMNTDTEIDLSAEMTNKIFIEQTTTALGEGKVFSRKIDTNKIPIKKIEVE